MSEDILRTYALSFLGLPYRWGGSSPLTGFDCSGLVCELLKSQGIITHSSDYSSQALYASFSQTWSATQSPQFGAIAFYGRSLSEIVHVAFCLGKTTMVEAGGGNSKTISDQVAREQGACVRIRPVYFRKDFLCLLVPRYSFS